MRKLFYSILVMLLSYTLLIADADAKRFGGGRSFGAQRNTASFARTNNATAATSAARPASAASKWLAPLAGLALGGMLGYLMMGHGLGAGILSWIAIAAAIFLIWSFIRSRLQPAAAQANKYQDNGMYQRSHAMQQPAYSSSYAPANEAIRYPVGFHPEEFIRNAKVSFMRLQAANDNKNLDDLRQFTTPEVFAEAQLQIQERGQDDNYTEVVSLDAELLDAGSEFQSMIASVRFTGLIKEAREAAATHFNEIWHFRNDNTHEGWRVAGIQQ